MAKTTIVVASYSGLYEKKVMLSTLTVFGQLS